MIKKILMWSIYAGVVGLLIFGAVIRTEAKTDGIDPRAEARFEGRDSDPLGRGGNAGGSNAEGQDTGGSGQGYGRNENPAGTGDETHLAEDEEHDWISLTGSVSSQDAESLRIEIGQDEILEITGRAWRFIRENGLEFKTGDQVALEGFYENGEYEVSLITNLSADLSLQVREGSGRPLWSGGAGR